MAPPASLPEKKYSTLKRSRWGEDKAPRNQSQEWRLVGKGRDWPLFWMPEKDFQSHCESVASGLGWKHSHAHLPYFDTAGIPDLTVVHPIKRRAMFRELKVRNKKGLYVPPKGAQADWLVWLANAGLDVDVWLWPDDDERIFEEL